MAAQLAERYRIIDTDTHYVEPPDLWTSRLPKKWADAAPQVRWDDKVGEEAWYLGDVRMVGVGNAAQATYGQHAPRRPRRWEEIDPSTYDVRLRLAKMDEYGIYAAVLYPNVALFNSGHLKDADPQVSLAIVKAFNDYQVEFCSEDPERLLPITALPFWDLDATLAEIDRCVAIGHRGVTFSQNPAAFGLPHLTDPYWDRMWAKLQELSLPVNFHIATAANDLDIPAHKSIGSHARFASVQVKYFMDNAQTLSYLITGGICHRFPDLKFVSVESGIGWIPFALDAMDWQWLNAGVHKEHPDYKLLPSEFFKRQMYGCFWFEERNAHHAIDVIGADSVLYETDFPHPTSMTPSPASIALAPREFLDKNFADLPDDVLDKVLHSNAAKLYGVKSPAAAS